MLTLPRTSQLLVVARGRMLELLQPDAATGKTSTLLCKPLTPPFPQRLAQNNATPVHKEPGPKPFPSLSSSSAKEIFGVVRALTSFRLTGGSKDYIVVGSDSGRIVILEYLPDKNTLNRVHMETFGKSGGWMCGCACTPPPVDS